MATVSNNYRGQYQIAKKLNSSFESYWSKSGINNDSVKMVLQAIFNLLDDDIRKRTNDDNYNQTILDRIEFRDLCDIVSNILQKYLDVEQSDTKYTTDVVRTRIKKQIRDEIVSIAKQSSENESFSFDGIESSLESILQEFFKRTSNSSKKGTQKKGTSPKQIDVLKIFQDRLEKDKIGGVDQGSRFAKEIIKSDEYKELLQKCKTLFGNKTSSTSKIMALPKIVEEPKQTETIKQKRSSFRAVKLFSLFSRTNKNRKISTISSDISNKFMNTIVDDSISKTNHTIGGGILGVFGTGIKITTKSLKKLGSILMSTIKGIFSFFGTIFKPIGKFLGGMWNAITHPLETLKSVFKTSVGFMTKLLTAAFSNPANAYIFGYLAHMVVDFVKRKIWPYVEKYIINPMLLAMNFAKDYFGRFIDWVKNIFDNIYPALVFIGKLFKRRFDLNGDGATDLIARVILNMGDACGVILNTKFVTVLLKIGARIVDGLKKMANPSFMGGQLIHLPMLYRFGAAYAMGSGEGLGSLLQDDNGKLVIKGQEEDGRTQPEYDAHEVYQSIRDVLGKTDASLAEDRTALSETLKWSENSLSDIDAEQNKIFELNENIREKMSTDSDISKEELKEFFKSEIFKNENFESLFYGIMKTNGFGTNFSILSNEQKYSILSKLVSLRQLRVNKLLENLNSGNLDKIQQLRNLWNEDSLAITVSDIYSPPQLGILGGVPLSVKYKEEQKETRYNAYSSTYGAVNIPYQVGNGKFDDKVGLVLDYSDANTNQILTVHGIDSNSNLAQFMKSSGVRGQVTRGGTIVFPKTAKSVYVLAQYKQIQYNNRQARKVDSAIFNMLRQSQDFSKLLNIQNENLSPEQAKEILDRIIPNYTAMDVSDRIRAVNELIDQKLKNNIEQQKKLKEQVREIVSRNAILMINFKKNTERSDLTGDT